MLSFLKEYWFLITFLLAQIGFLISFYDRVKQSAIDTKEATKCSLRNDILEIYDRCKEDKKITHYELEAIQHSSELYFRLGGNSFVRAIVERVKSFELVD